MMDLPKILKDAVESFSSLSGVGDKTALRQVLQIAKRNDQDISSFSRSINGLLNLLRCDNCNMYCDTGICSVCSDNMRKDDGSICVVESVMDYLAIERSGKFNGTYYVLGGVLNPLLGIGPNELMLDKLIFRVKREETKELILALNPSVEGDATCSYIKDMMPKNVSVQRIGFGIPIGGSLEYLDGMTISKALENKQRL